MENWQKVMLKGTVEGEMALLSEGSSVKESPEDKQASAPCVRGRMFMWGPIFSVKSGLIPWFLDGSEYSVTPDNDTKIIFSTEIICSCPTGSRQIILVKTIPLSYT